MRRCRGLLLAVLLTSPSAALAAEAGAAPDRRPAVAPTPAAMAEYQRKLAAYKEARQKFDDLASVYWNAVAQKRRLRNAKRRDHQDVLVDDYVLTQPPLYAGPPPPRPPAQAGENEKEAPEPPPRKYIPVLADFLKSAQEHFGFVPQRPKSEIDFKRAYATAALAAGLTREQIVRVYAFETGGNGTYDAQAGREYSPTARAVSPALGYNQLLNTNSVELLAERGDELVAALRTKAAGSTGEPRQALESKIEVLRQMIKFCRTVPDDWTQHDVLANTPKGLGVHAMVLDIDVGPLLQTQKLLDSVVFARRKGYHAPLNAAELEMMNLTGDGNGLDMVMMPAAVRERVPTANFFLQPGYERNPVAIRNNVVAKLIAATNASMDRGVNLQGAKDLAAALSAR
jgi:hypothetical protein